MSTIFTQILKKRKEKNIFLEGVYNYSLDREDGGTVIKVDICAELTGKHRMGKKYLFPIPLLSHTSLRSFKYFKPRANLQHSEGHTY